MTVSAEIADGGTHSAIAIRSIMLADYFATSREVYFEQSTVATDY